jgi:hypothetical protein
MSDNIVHPTLEMRVAVTAVHSASSGLIGASSLSLLLLLLVVVLILQYYSIFILSLNQIECPPVHGPLHLQTFFPADAQRTFGNHDK